MADFFVDPGELRHQIEIQQATETVNDLGESELSWSTIFKLRAKVSELSGRELEFARQKRADVTHEVIVRWHPTEIKPQMRFLHDGKIHEIASVTDPDSRKVWWKILAVERVK